MPSKVLVVQRRLTQYRVPLFDRLRSSLAEEGIQLDLACASQTSEGNLRKDRGTLAWAHYVRALDVNVAGLQVFAHALPARLYRDENLIILNQENRQVINYWFQLVRRPEKARLAFWGHGRNFQGSGDRLRDRLKSAMTRRVDWWFAYTGLSARTVADVGYPQERITVLNNASDTTLMMAWREGIGPAEFEALRRALGLTGTHVGVFLGSLIEVKHLDVVFEAADRLRDRIPGFELLMVGDGPLRETVRRQVAARPWARWMGAATGREKVLQLSLAHVMLNPGMVGLGILDSFACGVPIVTTDCEIHSPEIAYLRSGVNGLMTANTVDAFAEGVSQVLQDEALRGRLIEGGRADAERYTLEAMVEKFKDGIIQALEAPRLVH